MKNLLRIIVFAALWPLLQQGARAATANEVYLTQRNSGNTLNVQRSVQAVASGVMAMTAGSVPEFTATLPAVSGLNLTNLNGSNIASGTVAAARLGSGSSITTKFLRGDNSWQTLSGGGDAVVATGLHQFAATTSAQFAGVISDETGTGVVVLATSPSLTTPAIGAATGTSLALTGGNVTVNQSAADPTVHVRATANTFNPVIKLEGWDRTFFVGVRDTGADGLFSISNTSALTSPLLSIDPTTGAAVFSGNVTASGAVTTIQNGAADPTLHVKTTADTYAPTVRFEGFNRNYFLGARDDGSDATFVLGTAAGFGSGILFSVTSLGSGAFSGNLTASGTGASSVAGTFAIAGTSAVAGIRTATASLNFADLAAGASEDLTITVTGAATGQSVSLGLVAAPTAGIVYQGFVSATNTVTVRATNITASPVNPTAETIRATVISF